MLAEVITHWEVAPSYFRLALGSSDGFVVPKAGQFFMVKTERRWKSFLRRPFSVHRYTCDERGRCFHLEILYKVVGQGTDELSQVRPGEGVDLLGPFGRGFSVEGKVKKASLVAGGVGVAPLFPLAEGLTRRGVKTRLFLGAKTREEILCVKDLQGLGVEIIVATEDGSLGYKGTVCELLMTTLSVDGERSAWDRTYACGPWEMLRELSAICSRFEMPLEVSLEARMACGFGACLGCSAKAKSESASGSPAVYKLVCRDGPVFDSQEVVWD
jgi:dihydroorotate dehydrogenase electron transfer subunit